MGHRSETCRLGTDGRSAAAHGIAEVPCFGSPSSAIQTQFKLRVAHYLGWTDLEEALARSGLPPTEFLLRRGHSCGVHSRWQRQREYRGCVGELAAGQRYWRAVLAKRVSTTRGERTGGRPSQSVGRQVWRPRTPESNLHGTRQPLRGRRWCSSLFGSAMRWSVIPQGFEREAACGSEFWYGALRSCC